MGKGIRIVGWLSVVLGLLGCDEQRLRELQEGVSTEAEVRAQFGEPQRVWMGERGERTFEYSRQPSGHRAYMATLGPDGRLLALRQVLTEENFARVQPGMTVEQVHRLLGRPMRITPYALKQETHHDWRYLESNTRSRVFTAVFDRDGRVLRTDSALDPETVESGYR